MQSKHIYVISVSDSSGYYIPVVSAKSEKAAEAMFQQFKKQQDNSYWDTCQSLSTWIEYIEE